MRRHFAKSVSGDNITEGGKTQIELGQEHTVTLQNSLSAEDWSGFKM